MTAEVSIRGGHASDLAVAQNWLQGAGLPAADLTRKHMQDFLLAHTADQAVGMIGLQGLGSVGLLRSLVVDPSIRSKGIGEQLVKALESRAAKKGINELWLLTIDADRYFVRLGYVAADRTDAPEAIKETEEFSTLCPGDATLMRKSL